MFSVRGRERVRDRVLRLAASDARVVAGAAVGSLALDEGDRWSDLDLTFAVPDNLSIPDVLKNWTRTLVSEFNAAHLFDLPSGASIYRVFLLPGCLQFDLSFTPVSKFGASGPKFKMLFGSAVEKPHVQPTSAEELFGYAVHHAVRAVFASNAAVTGRRSTGSVPLAITLSVSLVVAEVFPCSMAEALMTFLPKCANYSSVRW
jgi:hypothetical protein